MRGKKEKVLWIGKILDELFPDPQVPLNHSDPFTLLIATLLSAQCTDARVNQVTPRLFKRASTPAHMATVNVTELKKLIQKCGLYRVKSRAILGLSAMLVTNHAGKVPASFKSLEELPGVGHKTASVVMAHAFHVPSFPVDTHIHRCARRWGLSFGKSVEQTEKDLKRLFPKETWIRRHLQIIFFARKFCPARGHRQNECLICRQIMGTRGRSNE